MSKKVKKILIICLIVVGIVAIATGICFMLMPKDKEVFSKAFKKNMSQFRIDDLEEKFDIVEFLNSDDSKFKLETYTNIYKDDESATVSGDIYYKANELYADAEYISSVFQTEIEAVYKDSKFYHKVSDSYSKFYYTDFDLSELLSAFATTDDSIPNIDDSVIDYIENAIINIIDDENLVKEKKELTLGGKSFNTNKYTLSLTAKDTLTIFKSILSDVKNDKELYNLFMSTFGKTLSYDEIMSSIDEDIKKADAENIVLSYSIYLDGDDIISNEFVLSIDSEESTVPIRLTINTYKNDEGFDSEEIYLSVMGIKIFSAEFKGTSDTHTEIVIDFLNTVTITGTIEEDDDYFKAFLVGEFVENQDVSDKIRFDFEIDCKKISDKEYQADIGIKVNSSDDSDMFFDLRTTVKLSLDFDMPEVDLSDSASIDEMTEEDKETYLSMFGTSNSLVTE